MLVVVDVSAGVPLSERFAYAGAQQRQLNEHFAQMWGFGADTVRVATPAALPKPGERQIRLRGDAPVAGALGVHEQDEFGVPYADVYVGLARKFNTPWQSIASHEALELTADPWGHLAVITANGFVDREVADRVEAQSYLIDNVPMSNFNGPACFEPPANLTGVKYDWLGSSTSADQVLPGGYSQRFDPSKGWIQITNGDMSPYRAYLFALGLGRAAARIARFPAMTRSSWFARLLGR